jgi:signal transduction histidine kinase
MQEHHLSNSEYLRTAFLERIAHDLRGPAGVTAGALDEIERALGPRAEELGPLLRMARRGVCRILRSADRLDRTSHLEAKHATWEIASCDLRRTIHQAVLETQRTEGRERVVVEYASDESPCMLNADASWLRAALAEIVSNAIRFAQSRVVIETREMETEVRIIVSDDGPGFSGPIAPRFERASARRGLGLSLPIVQDVVRAHGGRIDFQDRNRDVPGQSGTDVTIILPRDGTSAVLPRRGQHHKELPARGDP